MGSGMMQSELGSYHNGRRRYTIAMREPFDIPDQTIEIPAPDSAPMAPPQQNMLLTLLPSGIMVAGTVLAGILSAGNLALIIPMLVMSLGMPLATVIATQVQKKNYRKSVEEREKAYKEVLEKQHVELIALTDRYRKILEQEYPRWAPLVEIATARGKNKRLWWRRNYDPDFLTLRLGTGNSRPCFQLTLSTEFDRKDPLIKHAQKLLDVHEQVSDIPLLFSLKRVGSVVLAAKNTDHAYGLARKFLLELAVHHSPEDVSIALLADTPGAAERWGWLKWLPHTRAFNGQKRVRQLCFNTPDSRPFMNFLSTEYANRLEKRRNARPGETFGPPMVIVMDDSGLLRQSQEISGLAAEGHELGIYLIFVNQNATPNTCRARIELPDASTFRYLETFTVEAEAGSLSGVPELAVLSDCELAARTLAGLEVAGGQMSYALPDTVRTSQITAQDPFQAETLHQFWQHWPADDEQALFPVGIQVTREGPETLYLDFRPDWGTSRSGSSDFNAFLIGAPGSGKSIFLQSLVISSAYRYSPRILNFMLMDFKAGPSELAKARNLPHVVGFVDNLDMEKAGMAERALQALEREFRRRDELFIRNGRPNDIYAYNQRAPQDPLPHLLTIIDEFESGIRMVPNLVERLQKLGSLGRAYGMYFILANQRTIREMEALQDYVAWKILLKVQNPDEMRMVDRSLPIPRGRGHGYVRVKDRIIEFQGGWAGAKVSQTSLEDVERFTIDEVLPDGSTRTLYTHEPGLEKKAAVASSSQTEMDLFMDMIQEATARLEIKPAAPIYIEPIPADLSLGDVLDSTATFRTYHEEDWGDIRLADRRLTAAVGILDLPQECRQLPLVIDFKQKDGHLWIVGAPGSGTGKALSAVLLSLAATHRPDEVQFYLLEYGDGSLKGLEALPHTGGLIRLNEQERLERLLKLLDDTADERGKMDAGESGFSPELFVVINNFAELRTTYPDQADALARFVRTGKSLGIHLILVTNRGIEMNRNLSSNIAMRLVFQLTSVDEYYDVLGQRPFELSLKAEGRGYFKDEGFYECQIAGSDLNQAPFKDMKKHWKGALPRPISVLAERYPFAYLEQLLLQQTQVSGAVWAPVGITYDSQELLNINLNDEIPTWLVLGPRQSGKTNFLVSLAKGIDLMNPDLFEIVALTLRRGPLTTMKQAPCKVLGKLDEVSAELERLKTRPPCDNPKRYLLLIDDLGAFFEPGKESAGMLLNDVSARLNECSDFYLVAAGNRDELQMQMMAPVVRLLRQSRTGLVLSKDSSDADWLGASLSLQMRKMTMPAGRGFFVSKGMLQLVQTFQSLG